MAPHYPKMSRKQTNYMNYMYIYIHIYVIVVLSLSTVRFIVTPWTAARQAPLSMGSPRQEYLSGLPFPSPIHTETHIIYIYIITLWSCRSQIQRVKSKGRKRVKRPLQLSKWEVLNAWISGAARTIEMRKWMRVLFEKKTDMTLMIIKSLCFMSALVPVYHLEHVYSISSCGN